MHSETEKEVFHALGLCAAYLLASAATKLVLHFFLNSHSYWLVPFCQT